jgi:hypothetical protein
VPEIPESQPFSDVVFVCIGHEQFMHIYSKQQMCIFHECWCRPTVFFSTTMQMMVVEHHAYQPNWG